MMASLAKRPRCSHKSNLNVRQSEPNNPSSFPVLPETSEGNFGYKILVRNFDRKTTEEEIKSFFAKFGNVGKVLKRKKGSTTAFVTFASAEVALKVCEAPSEELMCSGKQLIIEYAVEERRVQVKSESLLNPLHDWPNSRDDSLFKLLPNEILAYVFSYLDVRERIGLEAVCRRWRYIGTQVPWRSPVKLVLDPTLPDTSKQNTVLTDKNLTGILLRCGRSLKHLTLAKYDGFTKKVVGLIGKYCPNLVELHLFRVPLYNAYLKQLASGCPNLKSVGIHEVSTLRDRTLSNFLKQFACLECFELSKVKSSLKKAEFCWGLSKNLRIFRATECRFLYPPVVLTQVMNQCDCLQEFSLNSARGNFNFPSDRLEFDLMGVPYQAVEDLWVAFFHHFKSTMKVVRLDANSLIVDWRPPICILHNLEELWLDSCFGVDIHFLECLAKRCRKLVSLNINKGDVNDESLAALASLPCLSILDVSYTSISGSGLEVLAFYGRLEEVYVRGCSHLKEESCCVLAKSCSNLRILDASGVKSVSQRLVDTFGKCLKDGCLASPVQLVVADTSVVDSTYKYEGLEVLVDERLKASRSYGVVYHR